MNPNHKLLPYQGEAYQDTQRYQRLVGKFIYLTITTPEISLPVGIVSELMQSPYIDHWDAAIRIAWKHPNTGLYDAD